MKKGSSGDSFRLGCGDDRNKSGVGCDSERLHSATARC